MSTTLTNRQRVADAAIVALLTGAAIIGWQNAPYNDPPVQHTDAGTECVLVYSHDDGSYSTIYHPNYYMDAGAEYCPTGNSINYGVPTEGELQ